MNPIHLIHPTKISLKDHPELNELWLQSIIADNPEIIGLGKLILKDKERVQAGAGRLDILLQDPEIHKRYEVEIQLGKTDESHLIRTIEYWDIERKRYPQYDHCAVIIAEEITSRFFNVISLFNGHIPLIAIQVSAYKHNDDYFLMFNTILNEMRLGLIDEDEEVLEVTDRSYWETQQGAPETVKMVDTVLAWINDVLPGYELKYNKFYIGLAQNTRTDNFTIFRPRKKTMNIEVRLDESEEIEQAMESSGIISSLDYVKRDGRYRLKLTAKDLKKNKDAILYLIRKAKGLELASGAEWTTLNANL